MIKIKKLFFTALIILIASPCLATQYYIDAVGGDNGDNGTTTSTPWLTLQKVNWTIFVAGDVLNFQGKFVGEDLFIDWAGAEGNPITFQQWDGETKWEIDADSSEDYGIRINKGYITLTDVEVYNANSHGIYVISGGGIVGTTINNIIVRNNAGVGLNITNNGLAGLITDTVTNNVVAHNNGAAGIAHGCLVNGAVHNNAVAYENGVTIESHGFTSYCDKIAESVENVTYNNCIAYGNLDVPGGFDEGHGFAADENSINVTFNQVQSYNNEGLGVSVNISHDCTIKNSIFYNNALNGITVNGLTTNTNILNSTFNNNTNGIQLFNTTSGSVLRNNIVSNSSEYGIKIGNTVIDTDNNYNLYFNNTTDDIVNGTKGANAVSDDPTFRPCSFYPEVGSPAIDAGVTLASVTKDLRGLTRPQNSIYDIGAYEFGPVLNISGLTIDGLTLE